jgi:hypothetical protein
MHLVYIDDSYEPPLYTFSALAVPAENWREVSGAIIAWRRSIKDSDGIFIRKELHATDFTSGRGAISSRIVTKWRRSEIFKQGLMLLSLLDVQLFNSCLSNNQDWAFERLLNRINRTMEEWDSHAMLICDEGNEAEFIRMVRRMGVYNPIPSRYGVWRDTGHLSRNIPIERIIEDPIFKVSAKSYLVQMADFCAYALLQKERPIPSKKKYGLHKAFEILQPICIRAANPRDPYGIIR